DDSLLAVLVETIASSLKLPYVALRLDDGDGSLALATETGARPVHMETLPLLHQQGKSANWSSRPARPAKRSPATTGSCWPPLHASLRPWCAPSSSPTRCKR